MTPSDPRQDDGSDVARDAHLLAALRHAPDRDALPPPALSAAILAQARAATRPQRRDPWWHAVRARWGAPPHWAAAFGSVAVAVLVGVLWSTHEPPSPMPDAPAALPAPAVQQPESAASADNAATLAQPPAEPARSNNVGGSAASPRARAERMETAQAAPPSAAPAARAVPESPAADTSASRDTAAAPAAAPVPAPQATAKAASPPPAQVPAEAAERRAAVEPLRARQETAAPAAALLAPQGAMAGAGAAPDPTARLDAWLAAQPRDALVWQVGAKGQAHGEVQQRWWLALREATRGRWARAPQPADTPVPWLVLAAGERREAALWWQGSDLMLRDGAALWRAPLDEARRRDWQQSVGSW